MFDFRRALDEMFDSNSNVSKVSKFVSNQQLGIIARVGFYILDFHPLMATLNKHNISYKLHRNYPYSQENFVA